MWRVGGGVGGCHISCILWNYTMVNPGGREDIPKSHHIRNNTAPEG